LHGRQVKPEATGVEFGQIGNGQIEQTDDGDQQQPGNQSATKTVDGAGIKKWSAYEAVGGTNQFAHFDLFALGQYLQTDGIADDDDEGEAQQGDQHQDAFFAQLQNRIEALDPIGVELRLPIVAIQSAGFPFLPGSEVQVSRNRRRAADSFLGFRLLQQSRRFVAVAPRLRPCW
jgi:hypothetical protein